MMFTESPESQVTSVCDYMKILLEVSKDIEQLYIYAHNSISLYTHMYGYRYIVFY